jgi:hypothetical protein
MGIDKTIARVSERYWWPKLFQASVGLSLHSIGMDHLGPFKATSDGKKTLQPR